MSGDSIFANNTSKISSPIKIQGKDRDTLYVKELLKEKQKQLTDQLEQLRDKNQAQFVQDKINTIEKLLSYQENKTQNK